MASRAVRPGLVNEDPQDLKNAPGGARIGGGRPSKDGPPERYRRLPTGAHGLAREEVERDQRERLQRAMTELIVQRGYQGVRILDLTQLAHVSRPTFYELYADKEELLLAAYDEIARRTAETAVAAIDFEAPLEERMRAGMRAFAELAAAEPDAMSLFLLGAFGAGPKALARRKATIRELEQALMSSRTSGGDPVAPALTVKVVLGGIREVAVARLHHGTTTELRKIADELTDWIAWFAPTLPPGLEGDPPGQREGEPTKDFASERSRGAQVRLPSGRHDLSRAQVAASQRERILDATAEIVAEKGLAALTIPEIASRANVSHETFYEMFHTKMEAFLGAQKFGMEGALGGGVEAWEAQMPDWPRAIDAGLRGVVGYLISEPAYARLVFVDAFGASPETIALRDELLRAYAERFLPGYDYAPDGMKVPEIAAEAVVGGCWQVIHHYIDNDRLDELAAAASQLTYMLLTPFMGAKRAAQVALSSPWLDGSAPPRAPLGSSAQAPA